MGVKNGKQKVGEKKNIMRSHYMLIVKQKSDLIDTENTLLVARGGG